MKLLFFAQCADWMGRRELNLRLPAPARLSNIIDHLKDLEPIRAHRRILKVAVNREWADFHREVRNGDEVAFMPPFSGG